ncbi:GrpB family protein [Ureibacillus chungkukjangi]
MTESIVNLNDYNPDWKKLFEYEKKILAALGDKVVGIEHIGSTSL